MVQEIQTPQVKVCGLTLVDEALACVELGADAIGLVFYPPSPRNVSLESARSIAKALPNRIPAIGVFTDPAWDDLVQAIEFCGIRGIQLHGNEHPDLITRLRNQFRITILKGLFTQKPPYLSEADGFKASAYLIECGKGPLPGGNAQAWAWGDAREFSLTHATMLAGGLTPDNVAEAVAACMPDAVDASSGLEASPGRKDLVKVAGFIAKVRETSHVYKPEIKSIRPIFKGV